MSWTRQKIAAALLATALAAGAAHADTLVVRSSGPSARSYPPGRAIAESARISLKANDVVVVLDGRGTRTLRGPGTFNAAETASAAADSRTSLASLVNQRTERRARIGAVRGGVPASAARADQARNPNIWFVDVDRSSPVCVADPAAVTLWRAVPTNAGAMTISDAGGRSATARWTAGQSSQPWPATLPVTNGAEYRLSWAGGTQPTVLRFAVLGGSPQGLESTASTLIKNGCQAQLDLLIETVAVPEPAAPAG